MLIVWAITGFWHGADWTFIIWGIYYFVFLSIERMTIGKNGIFSGVNLKLFKYPVRFVGHIYTLLIVAIGWMIFAINDIVSVKDYLMRMFAPIAGFDAAGFGLENYSIFMFSWLVIGAVLSTPIFVKLYESKKKSPIGAVFHLILFWASVIQLVDSAYNPFLYFRF